MVGIGFQQTVLLDRPSDSGTLILVEYGISFAKISTRIEKWFGEVLQRQRGKSC
jgi:hypothetical protein